ncbi:MAG TPA: RHS repeat-associated core domain-containing protein [Solirubrobacteraceae bacterium]
MGATLASWFPVVGRLRRAGRLLSVAAVLVVVGLLVLPPLASAESLCTDTWVGPSSGDWGTAASWSAGHAPTSTDVACVGASTVVSVTTVGRQAGVLVVQGTLEISPGSSLEVANGLEPSTVATLSMVGGTLTGAAEVDITGSFVGGGALSGSGTLVIDAGATGTVHSGSSMTLGRNLVNNGTFTLPGTTAVFGEESGTFTNNATLTVNAEGINAGLRRSSTMGVPPTLKNTGIVQKTGGTSETEVAFAINNNGSVSAKSGRLVFQAGGTSGTEAAGSWTSTAGCEIVLRSGSFALGAEMPLSGNMRISGTATVGQLAAAAASLTVENGALTVNGPAASTVRSLAAKQGTVTSAAEVDVSESFVGSENGTLAGQGGLVIEPAAQGEVKESNYLAFTGLLVNRSTFTIPINSGLIGSEGAVFLNEATLNLNGQEFQPFTRPTGMPRASTNEKPKLINVGTVRKIEGNKPAIIQFEFENFGLIQETTGPFEIAHPVAPAASSEYGEPENASGPEEERPTCGEDVSCGSGSLSKTQTDFAIGGRGVGLSLTRTYNSQAGVEGAKGVFGYGWTNAFSDHLSVEASSGQATLHQADGSTVVFKQATGTSFTAPAWSQDVLSGSEASGYTLTLKEQTVYRFAGPTGRLETVTDRNGNTTTVEYDEAGRIKSVADPAGRKLSLAYNAEGLVESAEDPMKHTVKYTYESGNLASVTQPGEAGLRWQFKYDASHELTELTDGRGGKAITRYNGVHQVYEQLDPMTRRTTLEYKPFQTVTTNQATGAVTVIQTTSTGLAAAITRGYGTSAATVETNLFDVASNVISATDGNNHTTKYTYDNAGNRTSQLDPTNHETTWTYNGTHDIRTETKPSGETTTYKRDSHGNPEVIERPAPSSTVQLTKYSYDTHGSLTSVEDPLKRVTKYEYDPAGDRTAEIDAEGDKRTWGYNEDSQETMMVSPRGHVSGALEASFTTTTERDAQGRPIKVTDPLKHETKYSYDANGNEETTTDPELHVTTYTYDADNERIKVKDANETVTETGYDGAGEITSQVDGNSHTTSYKRNVLEQVTEITDPLGRATLKGYDAAGNIKTVTDALKRVTTYTYDAANRIKEIAYSDGTTAGAKYEYNVDGGRTAMTDGTGTTTYEYDQLDRLTGTKDGHGNTTAYQYDLANQQTSITYPNGKAVTQGYDNAGRLAKSTDWLGHVTTWGYNADARLKSVLYPTGTTNEDVYNYDATDAMSEVKMTKGAETFASLTYARNKDGLVTKATTKGLPGEELPAFAYDKASRLTKGATVTYKYDKANDPTVIAANTYSYDAARELTTSKVTATKMLVATYSYDAVGARATLTPASGAATTYTYNQAGNLTGINRPKSETTPALEDTYAYNGDGIRVSQLIGGTTSYLTWDYAEKLPMVLSDGADYYIYGPDGAPVEQISPAGEVQYLHHDQQGSTRVITSTAGASEATFTYDAYGNRTGATGSATTQLGYDGQYTDPDTGLIYLRARYYDPSAAQFLSVDPRVMDTRAPYTYAEDSPTTLADPSGECTAVAASPIGPHNAATPQECKKKLNGLRRLTAKVKRRIKGLVVDEKKLSEAKRQGHVKALNQTSEALEEAISAFKSRGCQETLGVKIPAEIEQLAELRWRVTVHPIPLP